MQIVAFPNCRRAFIEHKYDTIVTMFILPYANDRAEDQSELFDEIEFNFEKILYFNSLTSK